MPKGLFAAARTAQAIDNATWTGTDRGLWREASGRKMFFGGQRYLPDDEVLAVLPDGWRGVWVRTNTGVAHLELLPMSLAQKAAIFEENIRLRHDRYGLVAPSILLKKGDLSSNRMNPDDNDGLWTAMYAAGEWFRFAVTGSENALERAQKCTKAVLFLSKVTGKRGFPARSYIKKGDWRAPGGVWHWTATGEYEWKADTSSDEIVGHFYLFSVAWDLAPRDQLELRAEIRETCRAIMDHILENGYNLVDIHGQPTYWGRWSPEYFAGERGKPDSPLNALELLSFLKTAQHVTGEEKYRHEYHKVAYQMGYAGLTARLLELREELNYSDEELAFLSFYPLMLYEKDAELLKIYRQAMDGWWQNARRERNPLWTYIYKAGNPAATVDLEGAARTLEEIPVDQVTWKVTNSHREDVSWENDRDRFGNRQSATLLPQDERPIMKWNGNPFRVDGGDGGGREEDGTYFLLPYWKGRYLKYRLGE